ncbi:hypothetical protein AJ78_07977 [Emergomyces pasteurianus Ep9510]|uniref:Uncharacterized protein n=1 Tax=Emergomyces pasteurianus Ep9510 TaxID=1447872 RepID=A0A1J9P4A9_9EURO|nr:hypothetical protein AJ78_07977 [Emergomyces pasteurianus Ep9510]
MIAAAERVETTVFQINVQSTFNTLNELQLKLKITHMERKKTEIERDNLCMRLELAKMQSDNQFLNPFISHVLYDRALEHDLNSLIGKKITTFLRTAKSVLKSLSLSDSSNYLI